MISIYLCDDEPLWLTRFSNAITNYQVKSDWEISLDYVGSSPEDLLCQLQQTNTKRGIYFLDIDLNASMDGITLGQHIQKLDADAYLVFVTMHSEKMKESFHLKLRALDYILKQEDNLELQICNCLKHMEEYYCSQPAASITTTLQANGSIHTLHKGEIYCLESLKGTHKIQIHLAHSSLIISGSLSELSIQLGDGFVLLRKGCLVNLSHIQRADISTKTIHLDNGMICDCSHRMWRDISKLLLQTED